MTEPRAEMGTMGAGAARIPAAAERGFTIIETMISMALLAFIVGDLAMVSIFATRTSALASRLVVATALGQNAIERSRNADFNIVDLPANPLTECFTFAGSPVACGTGGVFFSRTRTVTPSPILAATATADIDIVVSWHDAKGALQQFRVMSVLSRF